MQCVFENSGKKMLDICNYTHRKRLVKREADQLAEGKHLLILALYQR